MTDKNPNLLQDARIRAVVKENLYKGMLVRAITVPLLSVLFWYQTVVWPHPPWLIVALLAWGLNSLLYFALHVYHRRQPLEQRQLPAESQRYLQLLVWNCWLDSLLLGFVALFLIEVKPDWEIMVVVGTTMYMFSAFIKNMAHPTAARLLPALVYLPMTISFLLKTDSAHLIIAMYFIISTISMAIYGVNASSAILLPIKQRFELEELTVKLNIERERADAANAAKSNFFTAASHDARQPLQVISLLFQSLQKSSQINSQDKTVIDKIDVNLNTIRSLFDRVLDISRIDSGNVIPHMQAVQLQPLFDKFDAQFGELAASKGLWLRFVPTEAWVEQDPELLDRILSNLIHNAIKYTQTGGVWVAWRAARGRIEVRDTGLGISAKHQLTIFDEFAQINNPARNNDAGLGLGLSIVKRLADLTQTPIGLVSKLDHGSTFWLSLKKVEKTIPNILKTNDNINANINNAPLANLHLLYAEDEPQIRELFSNLLQAAGAVVYICTDVNDAKRYIDNQSLIHLVLTDYRLGESGTGVDIVQYARDQYRITDNNDNNVLPAIILTGDTAVKDLQSIQQLPHCTLLHKPLDFDRLVAELQAVAKLR
ncbi:MAG: hybrid sensor histidine kinase/response regulator [Burkholderiaceae bacterium]